MSCLIAFNVSNARQILILLKVMVCKWRNHHLGTMNFCNKCCARLFFIHVFIFLCKWKLWSAEASPKCSPLRGPRISKKYKNISDVCWPTSQNTKKLSWWYERKIGGIAKLFGMHPLGNLTFMAIHQKTEIVGFFWNSQGLQHGDPQSLYLKGPWRYWCIYNE